MARISIYPCIQQSIKICKKRDGMTANRCNLPALVWTRGPQVPRQCRGPDSSPRQRERSARPALILGPAHEENTTPTAKPKASQKLTDGPFQSLYMPTRLPLSYAPAQLRDFPATRRPLYGSAASPNRGYMALGAKCGRNTRRYISGRHEEKNEVMQSTVVQVSSLPKAIVLRIEAKENAPMFQRYNTPGAIYSSA